MGFGEIRLQADRLAVGGGGLVQAPQIFQRVAEIGMGFGEIRLEADGLAIGGNGVVELSEFFSATPRLKWASAKSGLASMAFL